MISPEALTTKSDIYILSFRGLSLYLLKKSIYLPFTNLQEGISRTVEAFSHLARDLDELSDAEKLLGSGKGLYDFLH